MMDVARWLAAHAIALLMVSVGLSTDRAVFRDLRGRLRLISRALLIVWIAVPLCALLTIYVVRPDRDSAAVLMILAVCPGVPLALGKSTRAQGDPRTSLLILISSALTAIAFTVLWAALLTRATSFSVPVTARDVGGVVLPMVIIPFAIGRAVNELWPRIAAPLAKLTKILFIAGAVLLVIAAIRAGAPAFRTLTLRDIIAALVIPNLAMAIGYFAAAAPRDQRISVGYAAALGNPALAVAVIAAAVPTATRPAFIALLVAFVLLRALALVPPTMLLKRSQRRL